MALAVYASDGERLLAEAAPDSGSTATHLSWRFAAPGRYFVRARVSDYQDGIDAFYLLSGLALPHSRCLLLISRGDPAEPAKAALGTGDGYQKAGVKRQDSGGRERK